MKKNTKGQIMNLSGLYNKNNNNYLSYYKGKNDYLKDLIINLEILKKMTKNFNAMENVEITYSNETIKFLNDSLKEYLKNIIQKLIENNRRRTYSSYFSFTKKNKIISYGINVLRDKNKEINDKKNKLFPQKTLTLIRTINVDKKLELLNKYNALKMNKKYKNEDEDSKSQNKKYDNDNSDRNDEGSDSSEYDFFQKKNRKKSEQSNKNENMGRMNVYQSHELTTNKNIKLKKFKMGRIELKDLIFYLEENQTIPLNRKTLFKAYTEMTISENK